MKKWAWIGGAVLVCCVWAAAVKQPEIVEADVDIPLEVRESMDSEVLAELTEKPKYIALTFDDGPRADTTGPLLDGLAQRGVSATFFLIGQQIQGNEALVLRMAAEGHQVGNHTYSHAMLIEESESRVIEEIRKTEVLLENLLGEGSYWLRPPYGLIDSARSSQVKTPMIYWTLDPEDWKLLDTRKVVDCVTTCVRPGDIVLLHDFYPTSVAAALDIIDILQEDGYTFVTVEELFAIEGVSPHSGVLYVSPQQVRAIP